MSDQAEADRLKRYFEAELGFAVGVAPDDVGFQCYRARYYGSGNVPKGSRGFLFDLKAVTPEQVLDHMKRTWDRPEVFDPESAQQALTSAEQAFGPEQHD